MNIEGAKMKHLNEKGLEKIKSFQKQIFWLTGLPCSGKTTIAKGLARRINAEILDGDDIRKIVHNQDFSLEGRKKHMLSVAEMAYRFSKYTNVVVALVSPLKSVREEIKAKYSNVTEIFVKCSLEECERRDVKGMYKLARAGEIKNFTGIDEPYEEPNTIRNKDHTHTTFVDTETFDVDLCINVILERHYNYNKHSLFIGRWQPLHEGHKKLFEEAKHKPLIGIRDTEIDENNPYSVQERIKMIKEQVPMAEVVVLPDVAEVVYGRSVGYEVREVKLDDKTESISATKIRKDENSNIP